MNVIDLLIGKKVKVMTDMKVEVILTIKSVKENNNFHSVVTKPGTRENDWWDETEQRGEAWVDVTFENGATKRYKSMQQIPIEDE